MKSTLAIWPLGVVHKPLRPTVVALNASFSLANSLARINDRDVTVGVSESRHLV